MSRVTTSICILESLKEKATEAVKKGYPGISSFSGLVENAVARYLVELEEANA